MDPLAQNNAPSAAVTASERSYPLISLFLLITAWAATASCVDGSQLRRVLETVDRPAAIGAIVSAGIAVGMLGAVLGLGQIKRVRGVLIGGTAGALYGVTILAALVAPAGLEHGLAAAAVLLVSTVAARARAR